MISFLVEISAGGEIYLLLISSSYRLAAATSGMQLATHRVPEARGITHIKLALKLGSKSKAYDFDF